MSTAYDPPDAGLIVSRFGQKRAKLEDQRVLLKHRTEPNRYRLVRPSDRSRFFEEGRRRSKANIRRRLGSWYHANGVMLTLTYDPKRIDQDTAWFHLGEHRRVFLNKLNLWRRRHGYERRSLASVVCVEPMKGTGYPHVHIVFPNLRFLAPLAVLGDLWAHGLTQVKYHDNLSPVSYACKYISKMSGWDDLSLAYLSMYHLRVYSISQRYYLPDVPVHDPEWLFWTSTTAAGSETLLDMVVLGHPDAMCCV
jgi:hypothetical protein